METTIINQENLNNVMEVTETLEETAAVVEQTANVNKFLDTKAAKATVIAVVAAGVVFVTTKWVVPAGKKAIAKLKAKKEAKEAAKAESTEVTSDEE